MKRTYYRLGLRSCDTDFECTVLAGSLTNTAIKPDKVTVEPYSDGFEETGGFQEITFE